MSAQLNLRLDVSLYYRTLADEFFVANLIPVGTERPLAVGAQRNIEAFTNAALLTAGGNDSIRRVGAGVLILMPVADVSDGNIPGPVLDPFYVPALVMENPLLNYGPRGTNKPAEEIVARYLALHQHFTRGGLTECTLNAGRNTIAALPREFTERGLVGYTINLQTTLPIVAPAKVATPRVSAAGDVVTISCPTAGAAIRFTTNNTEPYSSNPAASLYSAPFRAAPGSVVCAAAEKTSLIASNVASLEIP